jgi:beta-lactamase class A
MSAWDALDQLLDAAPGDYSACVQAAGDATIYAYAADDVRPAASLIKVPLAMALVVSDHARRGGEPGIDLDEVVTLREEDRVQGDGAWEGSFDTAPAGTTRTRWELIGHALRESDNTAANLLIAAIGMDEVNRFVREAPFHLRATRLQRRFIDFEAAAAGRENWTTARDMCRFFGALLGGDPRYDPIVEWLAQSPYDDALAAGVPEGTVVAHKVGGLPGVEHDAGIVYAPNAPYVVALLSQRLPGSAMGKATIAAASRLIYQRMVG